MLRNHISLMHGIKNPDLSLMPNTATHDPINTVGEELISKRPALDTRRDQQASVTWPGGFSAKRLKTQFRCSKCGFITEDRSQFQQHIPQHKMDDNTPQCLHCGLCFASWLSLNRHLFIVHKVKEPEVESEGVKTKLGVSKDEQEKEEEEEEVKSATKNEINLVPPTVEAIISKIGDTTRLHLDKTVDSNFTYNSPLETRDETVPRQNISHEMRDDFESLESC